MTGRIVHQPAERHACRPGWTERPTPPGSDLPFASYLAEVAPCAPAGTIWACGCGKTFVAYYCGQAGCLAVHWRPERYLERRMRQDGPAAPWVTLARHLCFGSLLVALSALVVHFVFRGPIMFSLLLAGAAFWRGTVALAEWRASRPHQPRPRPQPRPRRSTQRGGYPSGPATLADVEPPPEVRQANHQEIEAMLSLGPGHVTDHAIARGEARAVAEFEAAERRRDAELAAASGRRPDLDPDPDAPAWSPPAMRKDAPIDSQIEEPAQRWGACPPGVHVVRMGQHTCECGEEGAIG